MVGDVDHGAAERRYEIGLDGDVHDEIHLLIPTARVTAMPRCTVLWSRLRRREDFDVLLDTLMEMGITPREVYQAAHGSTADGAMGTGHDPYCEVRIGGYLGEAALHFLGWSHRVARTTVVELRATQEALGTALTRMAAIARVDYVLAR